jgi:hypothetical protein
MKKGATPPDIWNEGSKPQDSIPEILDDLPTKVEDLKTTPSPITHQMKYSLAGLKADFPTAKDLEQFVFDETNVALKLKGIDPEYKYAVALAVLKGEDIDPLYVTGDNPYLDNTELIPEDPLKPIPARDPRLPQEEPMSIFHDFTMPHPDLEMRALDAKVICMFKAYASGAVSYEIMGPLEKHAQGEKLDKYGRSRPEKFIWIDPRTGEQAIRYANGEYTPMGRRLRTLMESKRVNRNQSFWTTWIDRDFTQFNQGALENPWG